MNMKCIHRVGRCTRVDCFHRVACVLAVAFVGVCVLVLSDTEKKWPRMRER